MTITSDLRGFALVCDKQTKKTLLMAADRIDAEHEQQMRERKGCIHYDQERHYCNVHDLTTEDYKRGYDDGFASADDWLAQHEDAMTEHGWIRLPKDADGEYIHVGDVMEERSGHTFEVASLMAFGGSENWLALSDPRNFSSFREPHDIRHHHAPTVEDVLREFTDEVWNRCCEGTTASDSGIDELVAEYAAKLRLANDGEEQ